MGERGGRSGWAHRPPQSLPACLWGALGWTRRHFCLPVFCFVPEVFKPAFRRRLHTACPLGPHYCVRVSLGTPGKPSATSGRSVLLPQRASPRFVGLVNPEGSQRERHASPGFSQVLLCRWLLEVPAAQALARGIMRPAPQGRPQVGAGSWEGRGTPQTMAEPPRCPPFPEGAGKLCVPPAPPTGPLRPRRDRLQRGARPHSAPGPGPWRVGAGHPR